MHQVALNRSYAPLQKQSVHTSGSRTRTIVLKTHLVETPAQIGVHVAKKTFHEKLVRGHFSNLSPPAQKNSIRQLGIIHPNTAS